MINSHKSRRRPTVLVIDDDPLVHMVVEAGLESFGVFDVWTAVDGLTGLEIVEAAGPDFVFLDLVIPGLDGFGVLETLHNRDGGFDGMRVIVTSGQIDPDTVERLSALGISDVLRKPFSLEELKRAMRAAPVAGLPRAS